MSPPEKNRLVAGPAPIHQLSIGTAFNRLQPKEQRYAHHMSRAAWYGARIVLRQTSPEAIDIFDWIIALYHRCEGHWERLRDDSGLDQAELDSLLNYTACFLSNVGNYYGSGDQKFVPDLSMNILKRLSENQQMLQQATSIPPYSLGFSGTDSQSTYYPGPAHMSKTEIATVSEKLESQGIYPENTRINKGVDQAGRTTYHVLQASSKSNVDANRRVFTIDDAQIVLESGDHRAELEKICDELRLAATFAANEIQQRTLQQYIQSFETGDLETYRDALRLWVRDLAPKVEHIIGFVEPYRDPYGIRAEFEGLVAIADPEETQTLQRLVESSDKFIRQLPWCHDQKENNGKGPFEKSLFEPPDFSSIHVLAYCSSIIFPGINLPNYNDIRQDHGFKNVIIANRMSAESSSQVPNPYVAESEIERFQKSKFPAYYIWVVLHELVGHGTCKLLCQNGDGSFNFNAESPPVNPLNEQPIKSWYLPGQTWTGQFKDLATTVDECRAELVGAYLMDNKELLALFGYTDDTEPSADDLIYNVYVQLATDGLRGLMNFNVDSQSWGQAHSRAHFAILKCLLRNAQGCVKVDFDQDGARLTVRVDESTIIPHGKAALGDMLLHLHMYRSTADVQACREYYEDLSKVDGEYLEWRKVVLARQPPKWVFVHANSFLDGEIVTVKEYPATPEGVVQSWAERNV